MNLLHMKYAVEVANTGSINKASEKLLVAQPNLSRCIKELEADLGITIFARTPQGMHLTPDGEEFIRYAELALQRIDEIEKKYKNGAPVKQRFSISVPRASYISDAFVQFSHRLSSDPAEIYYMETNSSKAISNILNEGYHLGVIRYAVDYDRYFRDMLEEKGLTGELVAECIAKHTTLEELPLDAYRAHCELFSEDVYDDIRLETCVARRISEGGTGIVYILAE